MPIYRFHLDVLLPPAIVAERLQSVTGVMRTMFGTSNSQTELFFGCVKDGCFYLQRNIRYRNSFLPSIRGRISATNKGARVDVLMHLNPFVAAFMVFWLFMVGKAAFAFLSTQGLSTSALIPLGMFVFGVALTIGGFVPEAIKAKNLLTSLWQKDTPNPSFQRTRHDKAAQRR